MTVRHSSRMSSGASSARSRKIGSAFEQRVGPPSPSTSPSSCWWSLTASQYFSCWSAQPVTRRPARWRPDERRDRRRCGATSGERRGGERQPAAPDAPLRSRLTAAPTPGPELVVEPQRLVAHRLDRRAPAQQLARRARRHGADRGPEDPPDVGDGAALGAEPGRQDRAVEREVELGSSPIVAPMTAPNEPSGSSPALRRAQVVEHPARDQLAVLGAGVLHLRPLLVGGQRQHEQPGVVLAGGVDHRVERAEAEVRDGRDRVGGQRRGGVEVGVGVGLRGRADVAALDVEQHQRAGGPGLGDHPLQHGDPAAAEPLVERRLRLDHRDVRRQPLDRRQREPLQPGHVVGQPPLGQQPGVRVDARAQRAAGLEGGGEAGAERGHWTPFDESGGASPAPRRRTRCSPAAGRRRRRAGPGRPRPW